MKISIFVTVVIVLGLLVVVGFVYNALKNKKVGGTKAPEINDHRTVPIKPAPTPIISIPDPTEDVPPPATEYDTKNKKKLPGYGDAVVKTAKQAGIVGKPDEHGRVRVNFLGELEKRAGKKFLVVYNLTGLFFPLTRQQHYTISTNDGVVPETGYFGSLSPDGGQLGFENGNGSVENPTGGPIAAWVAHKMIMGTDDWVIGPKFNDMVTLRIRVPLSESDPVTYIKDYVSNHPKLLGQSTATGDNWLPKT